MIRLASGIPVCRLSNGPFGYRLIDRCFNHGVTSLPPPSILSAPKTIGLALKKACSQNGSYPSKTKIDNRQKSKHLSISINTNLIELGRNRKWTRILALYKKEKLNFNSVNYATAMSQLGRMPKILSNDPKFKAFLNDLYSCIVANGIRWIGPRQLSNIIHAIGKMGRQSNPTLLKLLGILEEADNAEWMFNNATPQGIANCVWACGSLEVQSPNLFRQLEKNAEWILKNSTPQGIANCVWACGSLGVQSPNLFRLLEENAECMFKNAIPQGVANCVWACGSLEIQSPNLFRLLDKNAEWMFENGDAQNIANSVWACGSLGVRSPNLFRLLEKNANWMFKNGDSQKIANCVWACGSLGIRSPNLFRLLEKNAEWILKNSTPQGIANCVWACGSLEILSPNLFQQLEKNANWMFENGDSQNIANCTLALSLLGWSAPRLLAALDDGLCHFLASADSQALVNVCFALAMHEGNSETVERVIPRIWNAMMTDDFMLSLDHVGQVLYIQSFAEANGIQLTSMSLELRNHLDTVSHSVSSSSFEDSVSEKLITIGFPHEREVTLFNSRPGFLSIDIAFVDRMIAIECDGPSHFVYIVGNSKRLIENGKTKAKRRLLHQLGWKVINLNWMEYAANKNPQCWLKEKLNEAHVDL